jgi:uncharacterized membrane protein
MDLIESARPALTLTTALGCGLIGGTFFAFSTFVMPALRRLEPHEGIAAMQQINVVVVRSLFLPVFLGTAAASVLLVGVGLARWQQPYAIWLLVGGALYLVATVAVTGLGNVPLNDALATVAPSDPDAAARWARYQDGWMRWNHVRTVGALAATAALTLALHGGR